MSMGFIPVVNAGQFRRLGEGPSEADRVEEAKARALNQANGLVNAVKQDPTYDPYVVQTGVFNGYVYREGLAKWDIYPILLKEDLPIPPEGRVWVDMLNDPGTEHMWTLQKVAVAPVRTRTEYSWGWTVSPEPGTSAIQVLRIVRICTDTMPAMQRDSVTLPNGGWDVEFKPGYIECPSTEGGGGTGLQPEGEGVAGEPSVAEKLAGAATVGAFGIIALAVAGAFVRK